MMLWKKKISSLLILVLSLTLLPSIKAEAATAGSVVINEIAWGGSADSSSDEWIELYNTSNTAIDLSGWQILDDGSPIDTISSGTIGPYDYFLIEDNEEAVSNLTADAIIPLSFANSGDSLELQDELGNTIDSVNSSGGAWYAGDSGTGASMERIDPENTGDNADNWADAQSSNGSLSSGGSSVLGTPDSINSVYEGSGPAVTFNGLATVLAGENVTLAVEISEVEDLNGYGFDIQYDPNFFTFVSATEGPLLNADGSMTAFSASLEDGSEGKLVVGNARFNDPLSGISGSGELFSVTFQSLGDLGESEIAFGAESFLAGPVNDIPASLASQNILVSDGSVEEITNFTVEQSSKRFSFDLNWNPVTDAERYLVRRQMPNGAWMEIADITETSFVDNDLVTAGGKIMPNIEYQYQVVAIVGGIEGTPAIANGLEDRGLSGDFNRSDRVDGRDLIELSYHFGAQYGDADYQLLVDSNYDGLIDGNDLIDLGSNFGLTY